MNKGQIKRYFGTLAKIFKQPCRIILTGAAAGVIYGRIRSTMDIDFAVKFKTRSKRKADELWQDFSKATSEVTARTGIVVQFAEDIDRWSSITFLDYQENTRPFEWFGSIEVRLMDPCYWAIGKFTRYLDPDVRDLIEVLKKTKTTWSRLVSVSGQALKKSPKSTSCYQFRIQVEQFLASHGRLIWGKSFEPAKAVQKFHLCAGIKK